MNSLDNTIIAFNKIAKNQGAGTFGVDDETIDKKDLAWLTKLNNDYREGKDQLQPAHRVFIPKPNGKERPLGIPTIADRVQQQKLYQLLNPFYELKFSEWSFGFRPGKSCHDAIKRVKQRFQGIKWLIKIDIKGYFDTIDHHILMKMLEKDIHKNKTLQTINQWLKAGIMDNYQFQQTFSGSPQGGIISPLLANIYLNQIDIKINELIEKGIPIKKTNPEYRRLIRRQKGKSIKVDRFINQNQNIRVEYIRYADDFIIGCMGTREQADEMKTKVVNWLKYLKLTIAYDKSKIVPAHKGLRLLSYMIKINPTTSAIKRKVIKKSLNGKVRTLILKNEVNDRGKQWLRGEKITHNKQLINRDSLEIIRTYKRIVEGVIRYFAYGENLSQLMKLTYIAEYSCLKTPSG
ncbi:MAG: reverse transcriptase domain-containing protein ['Waltheria sp.' little leaf phytoplasma]|nr:reverse transcriptase domain-containing protein ['Waltheria sp.' little leaf phytoplasma]